VLSRAAQGSGVWLVTGVPDAPHSWNYLDDIRVLSARLATDDRGWGRVWHVPTAPPRSFAEVAADVARVTGRPVVPVRAVPRVVRALARVAATVRALHETAHQFQRRFVLDSTLTERTFALRPTPWEDALATTAAALARR
jgi:nucleoside-diphosphate-sugar epimerase